MKVAKRAVDVAARKVVAERLAKVAKAHAHARRAETYEPERIHKLRVASRIARAALDTFSGQLPERKQARLARDLRRLHRTCGEVRDWDVLIDGIATSTLERNDESGPAVDGLLGWAAAKRSDAQRKLEEHLTDRADRWDRIAGRSIPNRSRNENGLDLTLGEFAKSRIAPRMHGLFESVSLNVEDDSRLHRVRIEGKRLRYTLDVLDEWVPRTLSENLLANLKAMQDVLGRFHDGAVAEELLGKFANGVRTIHPPIWERVRPGVERLAEWYRSRKDAERLRFREWRDRWMIAGCPCPNCSVDWWAAEAKS